MIERGFLLKRGALYLALGAMVFFQHLHVWILGQTIFANGRKVCRLPARAIQILFDLWRHDEARYSVKQDIR